MPAKLKKVLRYLFFLSLAGFLFWLALRKTSPTQLWNDLITADFRWVLLSIGMGFLAYVSRGLRWVIILRQLGYKEVKNWNAIHSISIGYFANLAVPRAGEVARCTSLNQVEGVPVAKLFGTVILERAIDTLMLLGVVLLTFILERDTFSQFFDLALSNNSTTPEETSLLKYAVLGAFILLGFSVYFLRHKLLQMPFMAKVRAFWTELKEGFKVIFNLKQKGLFFFHTFFIWAMYYGMVYVCFFAVPYTQHLSPAEGLLVMVVGGLGMVVPVPGGIGAYHYLVVLGLSLLGISQTEGMSFATLVHSGQTLMALITGVLAVIFLYLERRKKAQA